jgi:hypothetical protein
MGSAGNSLDTPQLHFSSTGGWFAGCKRLAKFCDIAVMGTIPKMPRWFAGL